MLGVLAFVGGAGVSLWASWLLVSRIERMSGRLGVTEAVVGLLAALAADAPEITAAVSALAGHQQEVGAGVVVGSNVFNLAALLGLGAVAAGSVALHRRVVLLTGAVSLWIAAVCVVTVLGWVAPAASLVLVLGALGPYVWLAASRHRTRVGRWLTTAMNEEEVELHPALARVSTRLDLPVALGALIVVVVASVVMERAAISLGRDLSVPGVVVGAVVLAAVTSLPNAVAAVYLARRGRGTAMLSTALNSNALNIAVGLLLPAAVVGLGVTTSREAFVAMWNLGLTTVVLVLAYRERGLRRHTGAVILVAYGLFVATLAVVARGQVSALVLAGPAVLILAWTLVLLLVPPETRARALPIADPVVGNGKRGRTHVSLWPRSWSPSRLAALGCVLMATVAATDALLGPRAILIGLLIVGPCCGVLTGRGILAAALGLLALGCAVAVAVPDGIWLTWTQLAFTLAIGVVAVVATAVAALADRARPRLPS
jgi:cation:H+ antiporter